MDAWETFCQTGQVADYLQYRQIQAKADKLTQQKEHKLHGDVSGTGLSRTDSGRPWKIY